MEKQLLYLFLTFFTTIAAAFAGAFFALWRSKKENVRLLKQDAYLKIIESLHNIILWTDQEFKANFPYHIPGDSTGKNELTALRASQQASLNTLRKYVHLGELIISKGATKQLDKLFSEYFHEIIKHSEDPGPDLAIAHGLNDKSQEIISEHFKKLREITGKHIEEVRGIAKKDLSI